MTMGRPKTQGRCRVKPCTKDARSRHMCRSHYEKWNRERGHLRCRWEGCRNHQEDGGRRHGKGTAKVFYCREHEAEHLRPDADTEAANLWRLNAQITTYGDCWIALGPPAGRDGKYTYLTPEGGSDAAPWLAHRVAWDLLAGGHRKGLELDHAKCPGGPACCSPAHLQPVTHSENQRRRYRRDEWINWEAVGLPEVQRFAAHHGLPLPHRQDRTQDHTAYDLTV